MDGTYFKYGSGFDGFNKSRFNMTSFTVVYSSTENLQELPFNSTFEGFDHGLLIPINPIPTGSNGTDDNFMSLWIEIAWTVIFTLMILTATGGNCIVIWIVIAHRRMRTVTNYFLVNLSVADLLLTTFNCIFNFIYMIQRNWPFGSWYCTASNFIANATVAASVFTLTSISCDRHARSLYGDQLSSTSETFDPHTEYTSQWSTAPTGNVFKPPPNRTTRERNWCKNVWEQGYLAIVHPLQPRMSKTSSLIAVTFIWTASMIVAFPCLLYSTTITNKYKGQEKTGCILIWPDGKIVGSKFDFGYQILFLVITYVIPVILMIISYTTMGRELWGSRSIGEMTQRQIDSIRSKRKVVKMFILVVFIFAICWLPYHAYFLYVYYDPEVIFRQYTQHVYLGFYWFAMSNAMVNPLIYYWMNARFRQYFRTAICGWQECIFKSKCKGDDDSPAASKKRSHSMYRSELNGSRRSRKDTRPNFHQQASNHGFNHSIPGKTQIVEVGRITNDHVEKNNQKWLRNSLRKDSLNTTVNL